VFGNEWSMNAEEFRESGIAARQRSLNARGRVEKLVGS